MCLCIYGLVLPTHNPNSKPIPNPNPNPDPNPNPNKAGHGLQYFTIVAIEQFEENSKSIHHMKKAHGNIYCKLLIHWV